MNARRRMTMAMAITAQALLLGLATLAHAQADFDKLKSTTPEERARIQTMMMTEKLELTAEQKPKVAAINLETAQKMQPVIAGSEGPLMRMRQAKEINDQKEAALKQVLSSGQFEKYLASKEEMREKFEAKIAEHVKGGGS